MTWFEQLSEITEFKQQLGRCDAPQKYYIFPKLHQWVSNQRNKYRLLTSDKKALISNARIAKLENFGFKWNYDSQLALTMAWNGWVSDIL